MPSVSTTPSSTSCAGSTSCRLDHALRAAYAVAHSKEGHPRWRDAALDDALEVVRMVDDQHLARVRAAQHAFYAAWRPEERPVIARHREEVRQILQHSQAAVVAGGHVGELTRVLHLFRVEPHLPQVVIAWSAGAMALSERVVLFHDFVPHGVAQTEVFGEGLGVVRGLVPLPHMRRRLRVDDRVRMSVLARRFAPAQCLVLDDGARVPLSPEGRLPADARVLSEDGRVTEQVRHDRARPAGVSPRRLAINRLKDRKPLDAAAVDRFLARHEVPIVEGSRCTFLFRGEADEVFVVQRIVGLPELLPLRRLRGHRPVVPRPGAPRRVAGELSARDPARNPRRADQRPSQREAFVQPGRRLVRLLRTWVRATRVDDARSRCPARRAGARLTVPSRALRRDCPVTLYLPARFRRTASYPLLLVHDGPDFLQYAAAKTVLDNLIHRLDVAETIVAFLHPQERLTEYANSTAHSRFLTSELVPRLETKLPLVGKPLRPLPAGLQLRRGGLALGGVRSPDTYGSLVLMSGSFVFTDIGFDHGGGAVFDPVVKFVNRYRARPTHVADRLFVSCGVYEPLIAPNRSMVPTFESTGMTVRYVEARDGHNWENWRDRLRDALTWVYPGPQKFYYE